MSQTHNTSPDTHRHDQASLWIARLDKGLTPAQAAELQRWMNADPENHRLLMDMARLWDRMEVLGRLSALFPPPARTSPGIPAFVLGAFATVVLGLCVLWFAGVFDSPPPANSEHRYQTAIGEQKQVPLPDGSTLVLNTNTLVQVRYTSQQRLITLEQGELYVDVAPDVHRPLSVVAGDRVVQALGTQFNVKIHNDQKIELVVLEGKVQVGVHRPDTQQPALPEANADAHTLTAGEATLLGSATEEVTEISPADIEVKLSWRQGNLIFLGESLEDAVREVERYTSVEFVFLDQDLKKVRVAGLFKAGDVEGLLAALKENFDIVYHYEDKKVLLGKQ